MLKRFFSGKGQRAQQAAAAAVIFEVQEQGLCYALSLANDEDHWQLAAYLDQLFEEDFASQLSDRWLLPWDSLYQLLDDSEHASSLQLLGLPPLSKLQPLLASQGSLAEAGFKVFQTWRDPVGGAPVEVERCGAVVRCAGGFELLPRAVWELLHAVRALHAAQQESPGEITNQLGWSNIRKLAKRAGAGMDGFLDKTVVVKPNSLKLNPPKKIV